MAIEDLITKQLQLMDKVPHTVRPDSLVKMEAGVRILDTLLRYLNSTGHKPWRPTPLSPIVQMNSPLYFDILVLSIWLVDSEGKVSLLYSSEIFCIFKYLSISFKAILNGKATCIRSLSMIK